MIFDACMVKFSHCLFPARHLLNRLKMGCVTHSSAASKQLLSHMYMSKSDKQLSVTL